MMPNLFEALVCLKINHECWDCKNVQRAYTMTNKKAQSNRIKKMIEEDNNYADDDFKVDADA